MNKKRSLRKTKELKESTDMVCKNLYSTKLVKKGWAVAILILYVLSLAMTAYLYQRTKSIYLVTNRANYNNKFLLS